MQAVLYLASPLPPKQPPSLWQVAKPSVKIVNQFLFGRGMWNQAWRLRDKKFTKLVFAVKILLSFVYVSIGSLSSFNSGLLISQIVNEWVREREREREPVHNLHTWFHHLRLPCTCRSMPRPQSPWCTPIRTTGDPSAIDYCSITS